MLGRGDAISRLKSEDPWNFPQVLIAVFHQGGVRDGVELMMRWWSNSGVTWLFQWGSAPGETDLGNLHSFLGKGWTVVSQTSEENTKEQIADPHPLSSVPARWKKGKAGVGGLQWLLVSLALIPEEYSWIWIPVLHLRMIFDILTAQSQTSRKKTLHRGAVGIWQDGVFSGYERGFRDESNNLLLSLSLMFALRLSFSLRLAPYGCAGIHPGNQSLPVGFGPLPATSSFSLIYPAFH